ncbi:hypothetical protein GCM10007874_36140 [Labrys miyagiensis]|uniref:Uncharacterized protein n=1 Tax=Labrys miyagiensis TaxID=346912 RepID=A0ABQ6CJQ6_9HYPH|nr:hypothetical protein GCM10007874_36140 [Labrys miyagiensis]
MADCRLPDIEFLGGSGKATKTNAGLESPQCLEGREVAHWETLFLRDIEKSNGEMRLSGLFHQDISGAY